MEGAERKPLTLEKAKQSGIKLPCGELKLQGASSHVVGNGSVLREPEHNVGRKLIPECECKRYLFFCSAGV